MRRFDWYHNATIDGCDFFTTDRNGDAPQGALYGPFESYSAAKKDAIAYYQADIDRARESIAELRLRKKWDGFPIKHASKS